MRRIAAIVLAVVWIGCACAAARAADAEKPAAKPRSSAASGAKSKPADQKQPVPTGDAETQALAQVKRAWQDQYTKATTSVAKAAIAQRLLAQAASNSRRGSPDQYAQLKVARDIAIAAGDAATALAAIDALAASFDVDALSMKQELAVRGLNSPQTPGEKRSAALLAAAVAEDQIAAERFSAASSLLDKALVVAQQERDPRVVTMITARREEIGEVARAAELVAPARRVLDEKPNDPSANLAVGRFLCFWKGDWTGGLPRLAAGGSVSLKALAADDLSGGQSAEKMVELADRWWALAQENDGVSRKELQLHARRWYAKAAEATTDAKQKLALQKKVLETEPTAATRIALKPMEVARSKTTGGKSDPEAGKSAHKRLLKKGRYLSMRGVYLSNNKPTPFVNLTVPNSSSVQSETVMASLRGRIPTDKLSYRGMARIEIPVDGVYEFDQRFEKLWLNKREMGFNRNKGSVKLARGMYEIQVQETGSTMSGATLQIKNKDTGEDVPVFNFGGEIESFLARMIEVSGWQPVEIRLQADK